MATLSETKELLRRADAVCFDVDSTVIREEGIDELAKFCGVGDAVTEMCVCASERARALTIAFPPQGSWLAVSRYSSAVTLPLPHPPRTRKAMGGSMTFKTALSERLSIIRCSREQVNKLITDHPPQLTPGIR